MPKQWYEYIKKQQEKKAAEELEKEQKAYIALWLTEEEIAAAKGAIRTLGGKIVKVEDYKIPTSDVVHRLVLIEKVSPTPRAYPRAFAKIKKAPL